VSESKSGSPTVPIPTLPSKRYQQEYQQNSGCRRIRASSSDQRLW